ncbi:MAG: phosphoketolase family protein [Candidatus Dojkabacteria bacterium]|uniref:Phosphoketolase family protein n=1 Tax=Candidatus Dojkabacteria bacterium TaxID=2099670 RepID=A0A952DV50_9BACT|nr:phosphoketolase family protein [Candidatus Dojkabacteria bacterium]WKZ27452.1 MAG: phosphoketolase family protein [Candidatus Dojkabacteria bacterium]
MTALPKYLNNEDLVALNKYLRLADYIGAAQLYLKDNQLLEEELKPEHIKERILGHWGTVPGLNFIYACLNLVIKHRKQETMFIAGPGHGYPSLLANLYLEESLANFYPDYRVGKESLKRLIREFSWPGGFPSHSNPETPGAIHEGGELGYALSTAFGAAFDNPNLVVACVVGDGEAETGPTAAAWHSTKFLNPLTDGAVLPILHINKFKISGPTIFGTMDDEELENLFKGYGYKPYIVSGDILYEPMLSALDSAITDIKDIQSQAISGSYPLKPKWPVILLRSKKGWNGPKELKGLPIEDSFRSHGIPLEKVKKDETEFSVLKNWLESYELSELLDAEFKPIPEILDILPEKDLRMGMTKHGNGGAIAKELILPDLQIYEYSSFEPAKEYASSMGRLGEYLRDVIKLNPRNFRIMSPDETESNKLHSLFEVTDRGYMWPVPFGSENIGPEGRVMEILSEHTLQGWLQGYTLTGRHGVFISYEAFMMIVASMVDQYSKFLKQSDLISWRSPVPSMNIVLTSNAWRQDHNGFSHQNPGFISSVLNDQCNKVNVHFPADANMLLATMEDCLRTKNMVNVIITGKRELPQYMSIQEARLQIKSGINRWVWAGNHDSDPDVVFVATGDYMTQETLAAIKILKEIAPEMRTRFINISELTCFGIGDNRNLCRISLREFRELFTADREIIYNYHGYPEDIKHLIYNHPDAHRFHIKGYVEKGTTTTPFDMVVQNGTDRYSLAIEAIEYASAVNNEILIKKGTLQKQLEDILEKHRHFIKEHGEDIPEVTEFKL